MTMIDVYIAAMIGLDMMIVHALRKGPLKLMPSETQSAVKRTCTVIVLLLALTMGIASAQTSASEAPKLPHRIHLILKDGSYQIVTGYTVAGNIVRYVSAERGGAEEEIPVELVDLEATERWVKKHAPAAEGDQEQGRAPAIDPELLKEEEERSSLSPEVEPDLRLPQEDSLLVLDEFQGEPELVPLVQTDGDLNHTTSHSVLKKVLNPRAASHQILALRGTKSYVQLHVNDPVFYVRLGDGTEAPTGGAPLVVDTHGASSAAPNEYKSTAQSRYVVVQADVRVDARVIASFDASGNRETGDAIETKTDVLRGGHWMKVTPARSLEIGEYVLVEVLSDKEINLGVWDFGVHPISPENRDVIKPQPKRRSDLERRRPD
jgi:hypothetical protein